MKSKKFHLLSFLVFCLTVTFFFGCKEKEGPQFEYKSFPTNKNGYSIYSTYWQSTDKKIYFQLNSMETKSPRYSMFIGSGSPFATGNCHYAESKDGKKIYIVLEAPEKEKIDFAKCDGPDEKKQEELEYMFPDGKDCILRYEPDYTELDVKGAFVYKDSVFFHQAYSQILSEGDKTKVKSKGKVYDAIYIDEKDFTPKSRAFAYEEPDEKSPRRSMVPPNWSYYSADKKVTVLKTERSESWYHGVTLPIKARTEKKAKVGGTSDWWYYVKPFRGEDGFWIFGADIEPWENSKSQEYNDFILKSGLEDGYIKVSEVDYSQYPTDMDYLSIGEEGESELFYNDSTIYLVNSYTRHFAAYPRSAMATDTDGFVKFKWGKEENQQYLFILGKQIHQYFTNFKNDGKLSYADDEEENVQGKYHDYYFKNISASSYYSETLGGRKIEYKPANLGRCFEIGCRCHPYWWNYSHIPWVEGAEGNGIGEYIDIEFTEEMEGMSVLNGYTDLNKLKLYKENARLKDVTMTDLASGKSWSVHFEDQVYFNYIEFPQKTTRVRMTISSTYSGTKYQDTCVSAVIPCKKNPDDSGNKQAVNKDFREIVRTYTEISPEELAKDLWP